MRVHDCILYNGESHLLDLRLNCHKNFVDYTIIIEAGSTHQGQQKPFYLEQQWDQFKEFHNKIKYYKIPAYNCGSSWINYTLHRNLGVLAIKDLPDDDIIFVSDLDEIGREETIVKIINELSEPASGIMRFCHYKFNCYCKNTPWYGFSVGRKKDVMSYYPSLDINTFVDREIGFEKFRNVRDKFKIYNNFGWHFSYLFDNNGIRNKLKSFAHAELNQDKILSDDNINDSLLNFRPLNPDTMGNWKFEKVELNSESAPTYVLENREKFKEFILDE